MTNEEAIASGKLKGKIRADVEFLVKTKEEAMAVQNHYKSLAKAGARSKFTGKRLEQELQRIERDYQSSSKTIVDTIDKRIDKLIHKKKIKKTTKTGKITKVVKDFAKDVSGGVSKTWNKIPAKGTIAVGGTVLVAAIAAATYRRYKKLEKERLENSKQLLKKTFEAKTRKYLKK